MRLFIAVDLDTILCRSLVGIQRQLKDTGADVKWVQPENMHLTLKFLGETPPDKLPVILDALAEVTGQSTAYRINLDKIGCFPDTHRPKIIWAGLNEGREETTKIADILEEVLEQAGFKREQRRFHAHLTLGRVRSGRRLRSLGEALRQQPNFQPVSQQAKTISLIQSTLTPQGPIYKIIRTYPLVKSSL